ncbi:MAG: FAD-binding oxidoreductase [Acidobacteria bacterium]|nr:MAG: FAD-binding oxidoreductase [Acidobacteriota bacterium]
MTVATAAEAASAVRAAKVSGISCRRSTSCPHLHLDLRPMHTIRFYQPGDLTVGADAGCTVAELNAVLAEHQQFVPLEVERPEITTLGAVLAQHLSGPLRHRFGSIRDFTIGLEMVAGDGSLVHCGGRVVKNVAGYDWMKPVIGARGAFGIITGVNFKVFPLPQDVERAVFSTLSWPQVEAFRSALLHSYLRPLAVELHARGEERSIEVVYCGSAAVRARYRAELGKLGAAGFSACALPAATPTVNVTYAAAEAVAALAALGAEVEIHGRLALGLYSISPRPRAFPGTLDPDPWPLLKRALDPDGIFHGDHCG